MKGSGLPARPPPDHDPRAGGGVIRRSLGGLLLAIPFLPLEVMFGPLKGADTLVPPGEWLLGIVVFAVSAWVVTFLLGDRLPTAGGAEKALGRGSDRIWVACSLAVLALLLLAVAFRAFERSPLLVDSIVQLFQAKIFASGSVSAPVPPESAAFAVQHMVEDGGKWFSQYPPGHPALLAFGVLGGAPWVVPILLTVGAGASLYLFTRQIYGWKSARILLLLLPLAPFLWFMGASYMNHVSTLFFVSVAVFLYARWESSGSLGCALGLGVALGMAALSRPLVGGAIATLVCVWGIQRIDNESPARYRKGVLAGATAFVAVSGLYLAYNGATTGDPLLPGYLKLWGESHGLGFHETPWGGQHTPVSGLRNELVDLSLLNVHLFEWPIPSLLPVGLMFLLGVDDDAWDRRLLVGALVIPSAYLFYWHRDAFLGPRFLYGTLVFLLPLTARALLLLARAADGGMVRVSSAVRAVDAGRWGMATVTLCVGYAALFGIPGRFGVYASGMESLKVDLVERARQAGIEQGLVFVKVSWGNRILAELRGLGVGASRAETAYRTIDHCALDSVLYRASKNEWSGHRVERTLERLDERTERAIPVPEATGDPTLRLIPGETLAESCRREIRYDREGFTVYTPHWVENRPDLGGDFVIARDLRGRNRLLMEEFPDRQAYLYDGRTFTRLDPHAVSTPPTLSPP